MKKQHRYLVDMSLDTQVTITDKELIHQWHNVLRFETGETVRLFDTHQEYEYKMISINKNEAVLERGNKVEHARSGDAIRVHIGLSLPKKDTFEWILAKMTELGVNKITPLASHRTEKKEINTERALKIIKEATEQCGRLTLLEIGEVVPFQDFLQDIKNQSSSVFILDPHSVQDFKDLKPNSSDIVLIIGPEGGFEEGEIALAIGHGAQTVRIGTNILKTETAAIVASALVRFSL